MVCPNPELLSAWHDGEVPSPWKEALAQHLAACPQCSEKIGQFRRCDDALLGIDQAGSPVEAAAERVYCRLLSAPTKVWRRDDWLKRNLAIPLPLAAAAAALILFLGGALLVSGQRNTQLRMAAEQASRSSQLANAPIGMDDVLQYLSSQGNGLNITISLPASGNFSGTGEPFMVRAADYKPAGGNQ